MIDRSTALTGLAPVREILQADGADIDLVGIEGGTVLLRLDLKDARCGECVVPRTMLEAIALQMMQPLVPGLTAVRIHDPRGESGDSEG
jgi:Fe-S cluster biogenesis protein NfuA